jgi:hypothetical protein
MENILSEIKWKDSKNFIVQVTCPVCQDKRDVNGYNAKRRAEFKDGQFYLMCQKCAFRNRPRDVAARVKGKHPFFDDKKWDDLEALSVDVQCPDCGMIRQVNAKYAIKNIPTLVKICRNCAAAESSKEKTMKAIKKQSLNKIQSNGCTLVPVKEGRCEKYETCEHYHECLEKVYERNWDGWRVENGT